MSVELSVVIPAKNAADVIALQLDALVVQAWTGDWEIVIADNGSTDETRRIVRRYAREHPRVRLIDASGRPGAGHARNVGIDQANGEFVAFCDADDIVAPGWVAAMGNALRNHSCVGGRLDFGQLNAPWLQTAFYGEAPDRNEVFAGIFPFSASANLGVRRSVIDEVGPFDDTYAPAEDMEFCLRLWTSGHDLTYVPQAVVNYRYRSTLGSLWRRSRDYAISAVLIARRLRELDKPTPSGWRGLKNYAWLIRRLPSLKSKRGQARWVVVAGAKWGRLVGSVKYRHLYL